MSRGYTAVAPVPRGSVNTVSLRVVTRFNGAHAFVPVLQLDAHRQRLPQRRTRRSSTAGDWQLRARSSSHSTASLKTLLPSACNRRSSKSSCVATDSTHEENMVMLTTGIAVDQASCCERPSAAKGALNTFPSKAKPESTSLYVHANPEHNADSQRTELPL